MSIWQIISYYAVSLSLSLSKPVTSTGSFYSLGGGLEGELGYTGCLADLQVDNRLTSARDWYGLERSGGLEVGGCSLVDWCAGPGPCQHGGSCGQLYHRAVCECEGTAYTGAVCSSSRHWRSCSQRLQAAPTHSRTGEVEVEVDIDGSGPLPPLPVLCGLDSQGRVITAVRHDNEDKTKVDGFQTRGSFSQYIHYQVREEAVRALVAASSSCQQTISYECCQSALADFAWWSSLGGQTNTFCSAQPCSCDGRPGWSQDVLTVTDKSLLPVAAVFFGDTGTPFDEKEGRFSVGQLQCRHQEEDRVITRRGQPLVLLSERERDEPPGEIVLSFSVSQTRPDLELVRLRRRGRTVGRLGLARGGTTLLYQWSLAHHNLNISIELDHVITDGLWHLVIIEHNAMEVMMALDIESVVTRQMMGQETDTESEYFLQEASNELHSYIQS